MAFYQTSLTTPFGPLLLTANETSLLALTFVASETPPALPETPLTRCNTALTKTISWIEAYLAGKAPSPHALSLAPQGSPFQRIVWEELCDVPYGKTVTYGDLAKSVGARLGKPKMSAQAIGGALHKNPIPLIIPCHRVVATQKGLGGFSVGLPIKRLLLAYEGVDLGYFTH